MEGDVMAPHHILRINAAATAACAAGMLAARGMLFPLFGLNSPLLLDAIAVGFLLCAGALWFAARRAPVQRQALLFFAIADMSWVVGSAFLLLFFWTGLAPIARIMIIAVALVVEIFATLELRAARTILDGSKTA
jgi:hypothetical protein